MPKKALKEKMLTVPEVKRLLEKIGEENLDQFQRRALDYAGKFSKLETKSVKPLIKELTGNYDFEQGEAVQIVNCMPENIEEIRVFLKGGRKIVETQKLKDILTLLNKYRKKE